MKIVHLGGGETVTGSCHLLQVHGLNILVDCGLAQGNDFVEPMDRWPVRPGDIDYLFLTHAHVDHIGRVPELIRRGFRGEIITTHPTKALLTPMLEDALGFQDMSRKEAAGLVEDVDSLSWGFEYGQEFDLGKHVTFMLGRAGHILGSCWIQFVISGEGVVVFSGDLGAVDTPVLCDPDIPEGCDLLILESTYGDRLHGDRRDRFRRLGKILDHALKDDGKVFIPAFALGRTQELIYEMDRWFGGREGERSKVKGERGRGGGRVPVFIDSPLGLEITKVYSRLAAYWDQEAGALLRGGDHPIDFEGLYAVRNHADHLRLCDMEGSAVVIAGSGMCSGGRIVNHLKGSIEDERNDVLFVGYQVRGTPGRDIVKYSKRAGGYVMLEGERLMIRSKVHVLTGYSAHADQKGLLEWVGAMPGKAGEVRLVHGGEKARRVLGGMLG